MAVLKRRLMMFSQCIASSKVIEMFHTNMFFNENIVQYVQSHDLGLSSSFSFYTYFILWTQLFPYWIVSLLASSSTMTLLPALPDVGPSKAVLTIFRIYIAKLLCLWLSEQAFAGVDYRKKGGDFMVALPWFRLPGKVEEISAKVIEGVSPLFVAQFLLLDQIFGYSSNLMNRLNPAFTLAKCGD